MVTRLKDLVIDRVALVPAGDDPEAQVVLWKSRGGSSTDDLADGTWSADVLKRAFTTAQRVASAKAGHAIPVRNDAGDVVDGRYPIENVADMMNAMRAIGRVAEGDRSAVVAHIKRQAKRLGATDRLGDAFKAFDKAPRLTESRVERLRQAYADLGAVLAEAGGEKEEGMTDDARKALVDGLPAELRDGVEKFLDGLEAERDDARKQLDELKVEVEKLKAAPPADEPTDEVEKALRDEAVPESVKAVLRSEKARREKAEAEGHDALERVSKIEEERATDLLVAKARDWRYLSLKAEDFGPRLRAIEKVDAETAREVERVLTAANAIANEAMREIGKTGGDATDAEKRFADRAEEIAKAKGISKESAMAELSATAEGKAMLGEVKAEREKEEV